MSRLRTIIVGVIMFVVFGGPALMVAVPLRSPVTIKPALIGGVVGLIAAVLGMLKDRQDQARGRAEALVIANTPVFPTARIVRR